MKVQDFSGREYKWPPQGYVVNPNSTRTRSSLHLRARALLRQIYPLHLILEEVPIPGLGLYADFYLPVQHVLVEAHGEQHYAYNPFYYRTKLEWAKAKTNDIDKQNWCLLNNIQYIELPYNESDDEWKQRILESR